nr:MAG TPA: hypothetical protein [Caudoviricetes sp.]
MDRYTLSEISLLFKNIKVELMEIYLDHSLRFLYRLRYFRFATLPVTCCIDLNE